MSGGTSSTSGDHAERITLVEIIMDECSNSHGQDPCSASGEPCYNTWNTCKDQCNFSCQTKSYWLATCDVSQHLASSYNANIIDISSSGTGLELGSAFSTRGRVSIRFRDSAHTDKGFDRYWPRGSIPICAEDMPGTLFGRWIARVKYFEDRALRVYSGYADQPLCEFRVQNYIISSISGPDSSCTVTIVAKDPLILADDNTAKCPSSDNALVATRVVGDEFSYPFKTALALDGIGDDAFPNAAVGSYLFANNYMRGDADQDTFFGRLQHMCIGKEIVRVVAEYNTLSVPHGWNVRLLERAVCGTSIAPHDANAEITAAATFTNEHISDVVCRLLTEYADIEDVALNCCEDGKIALIDYSAFEQFRCLSPLSIISETVICKPTGVSSLLNELAEQFLFFLYPDSDTGLITIKPISPPDCNDDVEILYSCDAAEGSVSNTTSSNHYNQVRINADPGDWTATIGADNSKLVIITATVDSVREPCNRREYKSRSTKTINSRWITASNSYIGYSSGERWLRLKQCPSKTVTMNVTFDKSTTVKLGHYRRISNKKIQRTDGTNDTDTLWLVKSVQPSGDLMRLTLESMPFGDGMQSACLSCDESMCPTVLSEGDECLDIDCVGVW